MGLSGGLTGCISALQDFAFALAGVVVQLARVMSSAVAMILSG